MKMKSLIAPGVIGLLTLLLWAPTSQAYDTYSSGKTITYRTGEPGEPFGNCRTCHGNFRATDELNGRPYLQDEYISPTDGKPWRVIYQEVGASAPAEEVGLHDIHRHVILDKIGRSRCNVCHTRPPGFYPVYLSSSSTTDLEPISCLGCHGRDEGDGFATGAGLRQHHTTSGITVCKTCHEDADPAVFTTVGEDVLPPYYFEPDTVFVNLPTDPCNWNGAENYAGGRKGLDNDGDGRYDKYDRDCRPFGHHDDRDDDDDDEDDDDDD